MCISAIAIQQHALFPLIIVHNRDESRNRPFSPLGSVPVASNSPIWGGIDHKSEGMWFGITERGKIGLITSFRDRSRKNPQAPSRGFLVRDYLMSTASASE